MSDLNPYEEGLALELQEAKGRIKALQKALKDQSSVSDRLAEQLAAARKDAEEAEAYAAELEAKLAKAVVALEECVEEIDAYIQHQYPHDHPVQERHRQQDYASNPARLALAELTGGKDV